MNIVETVHVDAFSSCATRTKILFTLYNYTKSSCFSFPKLWLESHDYIYSFKCKLVHFIFTQCHVFCSLHTVPVNKPFMPAFQFLVPEIVIIIFILFKCVIWKRIFGFFARDYARLICLIPAANKVSLQYRLKSLAVAEEAKYSQENPSYLNDLIYKSWI